MANLSFLRGTLTQVNSAPVVDGQLLVASNVGQLFTDVGSNRVQINDIIKVESLPEATAANINKVYYATTTNVLAVSNGTSWKQINAQQVIAEGSTAGTISVGGVDVPVHGLGSAAYEDTTAFDAAGSAAAVLGDAEDTATDNTVYGAKAAAAAAQTAADNAQDAAEAAQTAADAKVASVTAANASINVDTTIATAPKLNVKLSEDEDNVLELVADGLKVATGSAPVYSIVKDGTATEGFASTYHLTKDGVNTGEAINIPKDYLVKSASIEEVATADTPYDGAQVGDKYIDFVVNAYEGEGNESHIYLPVNDLVDAYTAGNGIDVSATNVISAKVVAGNGLSVSEAGIAMAAASAGAAGAMSAADFSKLAGIAAGAEVNVVKSVAAPLTVNGEGQLTVGAASGTAAGTMSAADFTKLAGIAEGAEVNVIDAITFNGSAVSVTSKTAAITLAWTDLA